MSVNAAVIELSGVLDSLQGEQLRHQIAQLSRSGADRVLLDCTAITFVDSSGLGALVMAFRHLRETGGQLSVCSISDPMRLPLELTGLDQVLPIFPNQEAFHQALVAQVS